MINDFIIYGNGGHAKVVKELIQLIKGNIVAVYDNETLYDPLAFPDAQVVIAIGNNECRKAVSEKIKHPFATLVHPKAVVAKNAMVAAGTVILANAVIQEQAVIGKHCIIQPNVTIDHDASIGDFTIIYPNSYIGGEAKVLDNTNVPPNSFISRQTVFTNTELV